MREWKEKDYYIVYKRVNGKRVILDPESDLRFKTKKAAEKYRNKMNKKYRQHNIDLPYNSVEFFIEKPIYLV